MKFVRSHVRLLAITTACVSAFAGLVLLFVFLPNPSDVAQAAFPGWSQINTIFYTTAQNNNQIILNTVRDLQSSLEPVAGKAFTTKNLGQNVALGNTKITSSVPPDSGWPGLPYLVDGDAVLFGSNYVPLGSGRQWVQIDLEDSFFINKVNLRHNYADGRTYKDVAVQLSEDGATWVTIFNNDTNNSLGLGAGTDSEYASTIAGKDIILTAPIQGRYVKTWSNGSNVGSQNFYVEIEVYGTYVTPRSEKNGIFLTVDPNNAELASKKNEAFKMYTDAYGLHIVGRNPFAVRNGVYSLLDKLGYRWYFLHPAWSVVPSVLQNLDITEIKEPFFLERTIGAGLSTSALGVDPNGSALYGNWLRRNRMVSDSVYKIHHSWPDFANKNDVKLQDPSAVCYKADGITPQQVLPDSLTVITRALNYARAWFANPLERNAYTGDWQTKQVVPMSPPDGNAIWCNEWLKNPADPGDYDPQLVSNKAFGLTNEVAKMLQTEYPGKYAGIMSYSWYPLSPSYAIAPNIYANVTTFTRGTALTPAQRLVAMKGKGVLTGFYDYFDVWAWWKDRIEPAGKYAVFLKALKEAVDIKADVLEVEGSDNWGPKGRLYWIVSRYAWDPTQTFDQLLDDFYTNAFGPAQDIMKRYYTRFDTQWLNQYSDSPDNNRVMGLAFRDLNEAMALSSASAEIQERIRHVLYHTYFWWKWGDAVSGNYANFANAADAQEMYRFLWRIRDLHIVQFKQQEQSVKSVLQNTYGLTSAAVLALQNQAPPTKAEADAWLAAGVANWVGQDLIEASLVDVSNRTLSATNASTPAALQAVYYRQPSTRYEAWDGTNIIVPSSGNETISLEVMLLASGSGGAGPVTLEWVSPAGDVLASKVLSYLESGFYPTLRPIQWSVQAAAAGKYTLRSTTHNGWAVNLDRGAAHDISQDGVVSAGRQGYFYVPAGTPSLIVGLSQGSLTVTSPNNASYTATSGERGFRNPEAGFWKLEIPRETNAIGNTFNKKVWILGVPPLVWHDPEYLLVPSAAPAPAPIFAISSLAQYHMYKGESNTLRVLGSSFDPTVTFSLKFAQNGEVKASFSLNPQDSTTIQRTIQDSDISSLPAGLYDLIVQRSSDGESKTYTAAKVAITRRGDLWSSSATDAAVQKRDGKVDVNDVSRLFSKWNSIRAEDLAEADINGSKGATDGKIDLYDANKLMANWSP